MYCFVINEIYCTVHVASNDFVNDAVLKIIYLYTATVSTGTNHIERASSESSVTALDRPSFQQLMDEAATALSEGRDLELQEYRHSCGIPARMLLPKGKSNGMDFTLVVAVSNGSEDRVTETPEELENSKTHAHCGVHGHQYPDQRPMGYPLERRIPDERVILNIPNIRHTFVKVYHDPHH